MPNRVKNPTGFWGFAPKTVLKNAERFSTAQGIEAEQKRAGGFVGADSPVPAAGGNAPKT
jgi:hypothetical protein